MGTLKQPFFLKKIISILFALGALLYINAQPAKQYTFTHYSTATGLQSNHVNSVAQDETGYVWIATTEGLVRFDGTRYKTFQHNDNDASSIPSNDLFQLLTDKKKNLWVLTAKGRVGIFNTKNFKFREAIVKPKNDASVKVVPKRLLIDESGNIFLLLPAYEILMWNEKNNNFTPLDNFFPVKTDWAFSGLAQQPGTQKYWMGIQGGGLAIYNKGTGNISYPGNNVENEPAVENCRTFTSPANFLFDKKGRFWFVSWGATYPYIYCCDLNKKNVTLEKHEFFSTLKTFNEINEVYEQQDGTIWIRGVNIFGRYEEVSKKFELVPAGYENEKGIDYRNITSLFEDREMNLWVGTGINGVFRFNPSQEFFSNIAYTSRTSGKKGEGNVLSLFAVNDGTILVGTLHDGLYRYDKQFNSIPLNIKGIGEKNSIRVWDMCASYNKNITWLAAHPGVYKYDSKSRSAEVYLPAILKDEMVRQIAEDNDGNLWLGTEKQGILKWNAVKGRKNFDEGLMPFDSIQNVKVNNITVDSRGMVWIATSSQGLYVVDPGTDKVTMHFHYRSKDELRSDEAVSNVLEYNDSIMLITTMTRIMVYNRLRDKAQVLGTPETIGGNITSIQKDDAGNLWIGTSVGLYRATIKTRVFVRFNRDDGITNDFFILGAACNLPDGKLLFGAVGQFTVFNPSDIGVSSAPPNIDITDFKVMNRSLPVDSLLQLKQIELGYEDNSLTVDFSTLAYVSAHLIQYKLENIDKDWKTANKNNEAIYSYLPPGEYALQFKTIDSDGKINLSPVVVRIKINAPFWKTWWFYSLLLLIAGCLLFWLDKTRMKRKETLQKMRTSIAGNLHEEINTALNNINILSEMAKLKADKEPQKSKEFIDQIHARSHKMIIAMDDMLWSISPENDSMEKTVMRMQEYIDSMNNRCGTSNKMLADDKVKLLNLDMHFRHEAFLLFKECIIGLLDAGVLTYKIHVMMDKSNLLYNIDFNNEGSEKQQLITVLEKLERSKHTAAINAKLNLQMQKNNSLLEIKMLVA